MNDNLKQAIADASKKLYAAHTDYDKIRDDVITDLSTISKIDECRVCDIIIELEEHFWGDPSFNAKKCEKEMTKEFNSAFSDIQKEIAETKIEQLRTEIFKLEKICLH